MNENAHCRVDTRLAALLAETYRSSERALKELVDNAWDADADSVRVTLPRALTDEPIVIRADGSGMTAPEVRNEYLVVANDRQPRKGERSTLKARKIKGKKGVPNVPLDGTRLGFRRREGTKGGNVPAKAPILF